jgi:hypothetical protein
MLDPAAAMPVWFSITPARFHDSKVRGDLPLKAGETYVFDRAYNNADFWRAIDEKGAFFVTRAKTNLAFDVIANRLHPNSLIIADETIRLARRPGEKSQSHPTANRHCLNRLCLAQDLAPDPAYHRPTEARRGFGANLPFQQKRDSPAP